MPKLLASAALGAASMVLATAAHADAKVDCAHAMAQNDMNICAADAFAAVDAKLNKLYRALILRLDDKEKVQIRDAQKAWIAYRDAECRFTIRQNEGGSIYPMMWSGCLNQQTTTRIKELQAHLDCVDNKPGCTE